MQRGLLPGFILPATLCGCIDQAEVQTVPTPPPLTSSPSSIKEPPTASFISDPTELIGRIDTYAPYETLCPLGYGSSFISDGYAALSCERSDGLYLFLQESDKGTHRFINAMLVPRNSNKEFLVSYMNCDFEGEFSYEFLTNLFILVRDIGNDDFEVLHVWRINFSTQQFEPLSSQGTSVISSCMRAP